MRGRKVTEETPNRNPPPAGGVCRGRVVTGAALNGSVWGATGATTNRTPPSRRGGQRGNIHRKPPPAGGVFRGRVARGETSIINSPPPPPPADGVFRGRVATGAPPPGGTRTTGTAALTWSSANCVLLSESTVTARLVSRWKLVERTASGPPGLCSPPAPPPPPRSVERNFFFGVAPRFFFGVGSDDSCATY